MTKNFKVGNLKLFYLVVISMCYAFVAIKMPFNSGPDEAMRFAVLQDIVNFGRVANIYDSKSYFNPVWGISYSFLLSNFGYIVIYLCYKVVSYFIYPNFDLFVFARLSIAMIGIVNLVVLDKIIQSITNERKFTLQKVAVLCIVAFWPQVAFMFTYVNLDSFAILMTSLLILNYINGVKSNWNDNSIIYINVIIGFGIISYYNEFAIFLSCYLSMILSLFYKRYKYDVKYIIVKWVLGLSLLVIIILPYVLNNIYYYNDLFGMSVATNLQSVFSVDFLRNNHLSDYGLGRGLLPLFSNYSFWRSTLFSFIGAFGYMSIWFPNSIYLIFTVFFGIFSILGAKHFLDSELIKSVDGKLYFLFAICGIMVVLLMFIYYSYTAILYQPQGRYLFPSFIFIVSFSLIGIYNIKNKYMIYLLIVSIFLLYIYGLSLQFKFYHVDYLDKLTVIKIIFGVIIVILVKGLLGFIPKNINIIIFSLVFTYFLYFGYFCNFYVIPYNNLPKSDINNKCINCVASAKIIQINNQDLSDNVFNVQFLNSKYLPLKVSTQGHFSESSILIINGRYIDNIYNLYKYDAKNNYTNLNFIVRNLKVGFYNSLCVIDQDKKACGKMYLGNQVTADTNLSKVLHNLNGERIIEHNIVFAIDKKEVTDKYFIITGWAFPKSCTKFNNVALKVRYGDKVMYYISDLVVRHDVGAVYRCKNAEISGFKFILPQNMSTESINIVLTK